MGVGAYVGCVYRALVHVAVKACPTEAVPSEESRVGMLNDTALAVAFHKPQGLH